MTDAVDKVGDELRVGNNRILASSFLNQCCAPDSYLESILLTRASKNVYRQHRPKADILLGHDMWAHTGLPLLAGYEGLVIDR